MSVNYHDAQVFLKEPEFTKLEEKVEYCRSLIGSTTYSDITGKVGKISSVKTVGSNVYLRVEVIS